MDYLYIGVEPPLSHYLSIPFPCDDEMCAPSWAWQRAIRPKCAPTLLAVPQLDTWQNICAFIDSNPREEVRRLCRSFGKPEPYSCCSLPTHTLTPAEVS